MGVLEMATTMNGMSLQENQEFLACTQQLGELMKELDGFPVLNTQTEVAAKSPNGASTEEKDNQAVHGESWDSNTFCSANGGMLCGVTACIVSLLAIAMVLKARRSTLS